MIYAFRYLLVAVYTIFWGLPATLVGLLGATETVMWIGRQWMRWIVWSCGIRVSASGLEHVDPTQPLIFMSNHQSVIDIAAIMLTLPVSIRFVAKRELTRIPFFGWALANSGNVLIDRGDRDQAVRSLERGAEQIRSGTSVIVFPEGTRSQKGTLGDFKSGGFYLALEARVPIVPVTVSGSHRITPKGTLRIDSGPVHVHYGKPIETGDLTLEDRYRLKELVREAIVAGFDRGLQPPSKAPTA